MDVTQNYFELFDMPPLFELSLEALSDRYRQLQRALHPDKFASSGASEQRIAVQFAAHVNAAYQTLQSPVLRAEYLLQLAGHPVDSDSMTLDDGAFLAQQMDWRDQLSTIQQRVARPGSAATVGDDGSFRSLQALTAQVKQAEQALLSRLALNFAAQSFVSMQAAVVKLRFVEKMLDDIRRAEDLLDDA